MKKLSLLLLPFIALNAVELKLSKTNPSIAVDIKKIKEKTKIMSVYLGFSISEPSLEIDNKKDEKLAEMDNGLSVAPIIGIKTKDNYIKKSNWGYFIKASATMFSFNKQNINNETKDLGTKIKGYSIFVIPTLFYNFHKKGNWNFKLGLGIGAGYLNFSGDFIVTNQNSTEYNQKVDVDESGIDLAVGVFMEYDYKNHSFIIQNFAPTLSGKDYNFMQHNVDIQYFYNFYF